jgi:hypothetical protein
MNLIREEDDGIINKEEGQKEITAADIQAVNEHLKVGIEEKKRQREKQVEMILKKDGGEPKPIRKLENRWASRQATAQPAEPAQVLLQRRKVSYEDRNNGSKDNPKADCGQKGAPPKKNENYLDLPKEAKDKKKRREPSTKSGKDDDGKRENSKKSRKSKGGQKDESAPVGDSKGLELGGQPKMDSPRPEQIVGSEQKDKKKKS